MTRNSHLIVMKKPVTPGVRVAELKARLSAYLRRVRAGESITVLDRDTPIARLVPIGAAAPLSVRRSHGRLQDLRLPPPLELGVDVVDLLLQERQADR